jgi:LNR domain.
VVGTSYKESVYVFLTTDGGATYGQVAKLTAADAAAGDNFGWSVAIDGNTVVVGAYGDDDGGADSGSAYVFRTTDGGTTYGQLAKLTAADAAAGDSFGYSMAIDGNAIVVGANGDQRAGVYTGSAYVFRTHDGGATYLEVARLRAVDAAGRRGLQSSPPRLAGGASSQDERDTTARRQLSAGCYYPNWKADGYCDSSNNVASCEYDGGDCCASTCVPASYTCGVVGYTCNAFDLRRLQSSVYEFGLYAVWKSTRQRRGK